jgi:hypothetical protein
MEAKWLLAAALVGLIGLGSLAILSRLLILGMLVLWTVAALIAAGFRRVAASVHQAPPTASAPPNEGGSVPRPPG